jgi:polyisoprenoid-binding protein YceI
MTKFATIALALALAGGAVASQAAAAPRPPPTKNYKDAIAGTYKLDRNHTGIVARIPHQGFSYSIFRFNDAQGTLVWDPAKPEASTLTVTVDTKSIDTPVNGFAEELSGERFLKSAQFPTATFTGKTFTVTDASHGKVVGDFTFLGQTKPLTLDVELIGAGPGGRGANIGISAKGKLNPADYALTLAGPGMVELQIDAELNRQNPPA